MLRKWLFKIRLHSQRLSIRAALFAILAIASSLMGVFLDEYVPDKFADIVGGDAAGSLLTMLASSMLIVVTFSLSTMVAAYGSATQSATPRATKLIIEDSNSHSAISIFLGAFIYSVVSLIALYTDYYGEKGRVILLGTTVLVLIAVVSVIIKWVGELKDMGQVNESIKRVEKVTLIALEERAQEPTFGCSPLKEIPSNVSPVYSHKIGHVQNIDINSLCEIAEKENFRVYIKSDIGSYVHTKETLLFVENSDKLDEKVYKKIQHCFSIGNERTFQSDPRYGISVLSGIALKALSPSLNDFGTAVDVIGSLARVLSIWENKRSCCSKKARYHRLYFPELRVEDLFNDAFYSIAREGSGSVIVIEALQQALGVFARSDNEDFYQSAKRHNKLLTTRSHKVSEFLKDDFNRVEKSESFH